MGQKTRFRQHVSDIARSDYIAWAKEHVLASVLALVSATLGVPGAMLIGNNSLWGEVVTLLAYSVLGPIALLLAGYVFFYIRAVGKAYGEHTAEIKELRTKLGMPTDDLEPPAKIKTVTVSWWSVGIFLASVAVLGDAYYLYFAVKSQSAAVQKQNVKIQQLLDGPLKKYSDQEVRLSSVEKKCRSVMDKCALIDKKADECVARSEKDRSDLRKCLSDLSEARSNQSPQGTGQKTRP